MASFSSSSRLFPNLAALLVWVVFCGCNALLSKADPWPIAPAVSQSLGDATLSVASLRFSKNRADPTAHQLLLLSDLLCVLRKDKVLYLRGLLESGAKIPSQAFGPATNERDLAGHLRKFAGAKPSHFQLLLFCSSNLLDPNRKELIVAMQRARRRGLNTDFEYLLRNVDRPIPPFALNPPYASELSPEDAKALANLAAEYAAKELAENPKSIKGKRITALGLLVDPENEELLYQMTLLEMGEPNQGVSHTSPKEYLLHKLGKISIRRGNSRLLNNLLHASMVEIQPDRFTSIVFLQKIKQQGIKIDFESVALEYEQFLKKKKRSPAPSSSHVPERELLDANLSNLLVGKRWILTNWHTKQTWFISFRRTSKSIFKPEGKCEGKQGNKLHTWMSWKIRDSVLVIDGYAKYAYDWKSSVWRQANGKKDSFLR